MSNAVTALPAAFDATVQTVNEQINALDTETASLEEENEIFQDQIAAAQKKIRANTRAIQRNAAKAAKLRRKREIASAAARALLEVDQP